MKKRIVQICCVLAVIVIALLAAPGIDTSRITGMVSGSETQENVDDMTVFKTKSGNCYHVDGCSYLRSSSIETTYGEAKAEGLEPCSRCNPDRWINY